MTNRLLRSLLLVGCALIATNGTRQIYGNDSQQIDLRPLSLNPERPRQWRVGELEFVNAWELSSDNHDFGGISALTRLPDGRFYGTGDAGTLIGFGLSGKEAIDRPFIAPLPGAFDKGKSFRDRDSESIASDPESGRVWVGFEANSAVRRYGPGFSREEASVYPTEMGPWDGNSGAEAMVRFPDGRFALFSEGYDRPDGSYEALMFSGDPIEPGTRVFRFGYFPPSGFKITDATLLPDGSILTLNRRVAFPKGFEAKLAIIDPADIAKGLSLRPRVIAHLISPLLVDNMEGITTSQENGRTMIWMISDDNFAVFQRTILMKFALIEAKKKPDAASAPGFQSIQ